MLGQSLGEQFADAERQDHALRLGMWLFLASELLLFAGLFALIAAYRAMYGDEFAAAVAHNDVLIGTVNTLVLITSSFTVALTIWAVRSERLGWVAPLLAITLAFGVVFLILKGFEYRAHFHEGIFPGQKYRFAEMPGYGAKMFFTLYFLTTGLHGLHVVAGMTVLGFLALNARRRRYTPERHVGLEMGALYWHLVDVIWIFLWPLLYLARA